jgi:hypothetical protein
MASPWGVWRHLRREVEARAWILFGVIALDAVALVALVRVKW